MTDVASLDGLTATPHDQPFPGAEPKTVRLQLSAGERVPAHSHPDRDVLVYVVTGDLTVELDAETHELSAGDLLRFDGRREISPVARTDATALVVLARK